MPDELIQPPSKVGLTHSQRRNIAHQKNQKRSAQRGARTHDNSMPTPLEAEGEPCKSRMLYQLS
ncbi:hypothetical protein PGTUg99_010689 [Puccinia graminis f. sp. tritici]|uniref:Uncharacterized protein n=1 Tax=Puccinia graminis f. sp. tritici TaxID=56615 RepID=A0A5B0S5K1_PUCGR|nr:hypothetical protein PGTUg99_010689 [Puccinia graminis f. sp. tritici]